MRFQDRWDAGRQLARLLEEKYKDSNGIVYPLPRGGIPLGIEIARALDMPLGMIIPRKIGHPSSPEYAICAVAENGETVCNEREVANVDPSWFEQRVEQAQQESRRRRRVYLGNQPPLPLEGKIAILVDDGIATGLTMRAAIRDARYRKAASIVVAIPVAPKDTADLLEKEVDDVVALSIDDHYLGAVGAYYNKFNQLNDEEVISMLREFNDSRTSTLAMEQ
ncbi:MAG: phosphoribosyltransferase [Gammaproteobacteria bacterium]|nr:MAG: phosphoribosyltransferase [Gammaproteobacteria bacterium]